MIARSPMFSIGLICLGALAFSAQTTLPAPSELERLRAGNAELRKEIAALNARLAQAPSAQSQPAKQEAPRPFTTMADVLVNAPADLRPQARPDWYKFTEAKFTKWMQEQLVGMTVDVSLQYKGGPTMRNIINSHPGAEWMVFQGSFTGKKFTYFGAEHAWTVAYPTMTFDEAGARKWDTIKPGTLFKVKGVIKSVNIVDKKQNKSSLPEYVFYFVLSDLEIVPPK